MRSERVEDALRSIGRTMDQVERAFARPSLTMGSGLRGRLIRPRHPRVIAGVCAGVASHFGWNLLLLRLLVVVAGLMSFGVVAAGYLLAWVLLPEGQYGLGDGREGRHRMTRS